MMDKKIGFIGLGNMAGSLLEGLLQAGSLQGSQVVGFDIDAVKTAYFQNEYGITIASSEQELAKMVEVAVMGVKPNILESVIAKVKPQLRDKIVVSMVLGYSYERLHALFDESTRHVTMMPNTPVKVKAGVILFEQETNLAADEFAMIQEMFTAVALVKVLPAYQYKGASVLTGCAPAYVYMIIEALADGAVELGVPRDLAYELVSQVVQGGAMMQQGTKLHPGILKDQVCSPGGITIKGVNSLEANGLRNALIEAVKASSGK